MLAALPRRRGAARSRPDPALAADFAGLPERVAEHLDRAELTLALDEIWQRVRRLNRYVEERAPWQLAQGAGRARPSSDLVLAHARRGPARGHGAAVALPARRAAERLLARARRAGRLAARAPRSGLARSSGSRRSSRCSRRTGAAPRRDRLPHPPRPVRAARRGARRPRREAAGVRRILTVGIDGASCRAALAAAEDFPQVYAAIGRHPNAATRLRRRRPGRAARAGRPRALRGDRRDGPGLLPRRRAPRRPAARLRRPDRARARDGQAAGDPLAGRRARRRSTSWPPKPTGVSVVMHCFSMPERLEECLERGYAISFAGNVTYPSAADLAEAAARACREDGLLVETDAPYLTPQPRPPASPTSPPSSLTRSPSSRRCAGSRPRSWGRSSSANAAGCSAGHTPYRGTGERRGRGPRQPSLRRMRRFGMRPDRELGQNFLIDSNILGVIERAAELSPEDVVLEIGGGLGVLSEHLAERVAPRARDRDRRAPARGAAATRRRRTPT